MTLEIVNEGDDSCDTESETFNAGEELDIDIWWRTPTAIQFADGSVNSRRLIRRCVVAKTAWKVYSVTPDFWQDVEVVKEREEFEADRKARLAEIGEKGLGLSRAELLEAVDGVEA